MKLNSKNKNKVGWILMTIGVILLITASFLILKAGDINFQIGLVFFAGLFFIYGGAILLPEKSENTAI